jgi:hypothetical protein
MSGADQIALVGIAASTLMSVASLWVSLRANRISTRAQNVAEAAYFAERRIAIRSSIETDEHGSQYLLLAPAGSDQAINNVTLIFPRTIGIPSIALAAGDIRLYCTRISTQIARYWDARTPAKAGHAMVREHAPIPVAVVAHGHTKGEAVVTPSKDGHLEILSLVLNNWSLPDADPQAEADTVLRAHEAIA